MGTHITQQLLHGGVVGFLTGRHNGEVSCSHNTRIAADGRTQIPDAVARRRPRDVRWKIPATRCRARCQTTGGNAADRLAADPLSVQY